MPVQTPPVRSADYFRTPTAEASPSATSLLLHGADGSLWDLSRGVQGVLATVDIDGLGLPDFEVFTTTTVLPGARYRGRRVQPRQLTLPVLVESPDRSRFFDLDAAWWNAWDGVATLEVARATVSRQLDVQLAMAPGETFRQDPSLSGQQQYTLELVAYQPFWYDRVPTTATARWMASAPAGSFFGGAFGGPFSRLPLYDFASMQLANLGDVAVWPVYMVSGGCDGFDVGVGDRRVVFSAPIPQGQTVTVVTDPAARSVTLPDGTSRFSALTVQDFAPVPARSVALIAPDPWNPSAGCQVTASFTSRWRRPW